ncbi:MAG: adenylate/guanylate cyclase domain-containing protein [Acidimicrobiales bacterium]
MSSLASVATRLAGVIVVISLLSLLVAAVVGVITGRELGDELEDDQLVALRTSAAIDVEIIANGLLRSNQALAGSPQAVAAVELLDEAHADLLATPSAELDSEIEELVEVYQERYIEPLEAVGFDVNIRDVAGSNTASLYLQYHYAIDTGVIRQPSAIDDANDGSAWSELHAQVHPGYRDVVDRLQLADLFLVEPDNHTIVYSVNKRPDLGTSLEIGPFSGSLVASAVEQVIEDPSAGPVFTDFTFYIPTLVEPVGAVASPIMDGSQLVGVVVFLYDAAVFNASLTADADWDDAGFPSGSQTFMMGGDGLLRTEPRGFIEAPDLYVEAASDTGTIDDDDRALIELSGSTILVQSASEDLVNAATTGDTSSASRVTPIGTSGISTVERVDVDGVEWFVVSEIDRSLAADDLADFEELLIVGTAIFAVALAFLVVSWANGIVRPVRRISDRVSSGSTDTSTIEVPARSPLEFHRLADSFDSMATALAEHKEQLGEARQHRLDVLRQMLPPAMADRVAAGEVESLDEVPLATVAVIVVLGLGALVREEGDGADRDTVDRLHSELDELAARHGLERVKVVGDAYFAACGHDRPYIDHAPRVLAFAADARDGVRELGVDAPGGLDAAAGVHTGPVTVGMAGGDRMVYDVWGATVTTAHHLARRALAGEILITDDTAKMLPETTARVETDHTDGPKSWSVDPVNAGGNP